MIDIGTLRKPLRQWELNEVIEFLKGIITDYEKEIFLHNNLTGSRLKDFCCMDFLVHILRISESSAVKRPTRGRTNHDGAHMLEIQTTSRDPQPLV
uniref:Skp1 domain-containing protein n=1 Tax=Haemonchus contortus TaxID=6289 RepID=A0A7I4YPA9_HAECO